MPNHVTNRLTIIGTEEQVKQVREAIKGEGEDQFINFNKIAPIPKELVGTISPMRIISKEEYDEQERKIREDDLTDMERQWGLSRGLTQELADEYIAKFGHADWYGWQNENWGTKWNAYSQHELDENCIEFDTAWSTPYELMVKLSKLFPEVEFQVEYADEDFGYNVGTYTLLDGDSIDENIPDGGSREAIMMAMDIKGDEDYYLTDYLCYDTDDEELSEFEETLVEIAHEKGFLIDEYPISVLNKLKELALDNEQFERVIEIDQLLSVKETETEE
jgi:hypothetical protein